MANVDVIAVGTPAYGLQPWHWLILLVVLGLAAGGVWLIVRLASRPTKASGQSPSMVAPPGWYPDPQDPTGLRYFDGREWASALPPRPPT